MNTIEYLRQAKICLERLENYTQLQQMRIKSIPGEARNISR